jgi:cytochrome c oxidase accessory protein FixG
MPTPPVTIPLYKSEETIHPRSVSGWFARWRIVFVIATQLVFYGTPWLTWDGRQAVLFDLAARKFHLLGWVLWPQDFIFLTVLLMICAYSLFFFTTIAGRLWCGYACPQTVYTEIFLLIERWLEGDRPARMRFDRSGWTTQKLLRRGSKHIVWIALALWTGITFVGYFVPIRTMIPTMWAFELSTTATFWVLFYSFATYGNAGWMREQVCKYMCPYARFQSAMFDRDTLIVTYDQYRGEPRGRGRRDGSNTALGSCVDCSICVQVCPTGIDIRKGLQYECIGCGACIDGCNAVMDQTGQPRGLIRYTTLHALEARDESLVIKRLARWRTLLYGGVLIAVVIAFIGAFAARTPLKVDVIRDRHTLARVSDDGIVENSFRLFVMNKQEKSITLHLTLAGLPGASLADLSQATLIVPPATTQAFPVTVRAPHAGLKSGTQAVQFTLQSKDDVTLSVRETGNFYAPPNPGK